MNHLWRHRLRRLRFALGGLLAALPIVLAVLMALAQLLLPLAAHYPKRVAAMLSQRLQRPVGFASMDGHWQPSGPLLVLHDVRIGGTANGRALQLPTAEVKLDFGALLWPSRHWVNLRLSGMKLNLLRDAGGAWHVAGFGTSGGTSNRFSLQDLPGNLLLGDLDLDIADARSGRHYRLRVNPLRISNDGTTVRFAGLLSRPQAGVVRVVGRFAADGSAGRLYAGGKGVDLGAWLHDVDMGRYAVRAGQGAFGVWLDWHDGQPVGASAQLDLSDLRVRGGGGGVTVPRLQALLGYRRDAQGLHLRYAGSDAGAARADVDGPPQARVVDVRARDLDLAVMAPLASLVPQLPEGIAHWLAASQAHGNLRDASLRWQASGGLRSIRAHLRQAGFAPVGKAPGVDHLDVEVQGDHEAVAAELPRQKATVAMPHTFRKPFVLPTLAGTVVAWHDGDAWHVGTDALDFTGIGYAGQVRGTVSLADAGGAPSVDLYAHTDKGDVVAAKLFWPIDSMPPDTIKWLDKALVSGSVDHGDVVLRGDLGDWPFREHRGRFEARAVVSGLTLDYAPHWPRAEHIDAVASFVDNSMLVEAGAGSTQGLTVRKAVASIPDFAEGRLLISAQGHGKGSDLMGFVRASPILDDQRDTLKSLQVGGQGEFGMDIDLPLPHIQDFTLDGSLHLADAAVDDDDWGLHLQHVGGDLWFDKRGFRAPALSTVFRGSPSTLALAVGGDTGDAGRIVDAHLEGRFSVAQLVQGRDSLKALADAAEGDAAFDIGYRIDRMATTAPAAPAPASNGGGPAAAGTRASPPSAVPVGASDGDVAQTLSIDSDLQGIALHLPAPLDKAAGDALPLHFRLGLPEAGGSLRVAVGDVLRANARLPSSDGQPIAADVLLGDTMPQGTPAPGIRIGGHAHRLDVSGWIQRAFAVQASGTGDLRRVTVDADQAIVFDKRFDGLHLQLQPGPDQAQLQVSSPQMDGTLTVPAKDLAKRGIVARFKRLYWPEQKTAGAAPAPTTSTAPPATPVGNPADTGIDPASLPPMHLWIGDLRLGNARLGEARFESWPTAQGMHIDQLRTQSPSVHVSASGEWNGSAHDSHTHMVIDFSAASLGRMLDALGYQGLFNGGQTRAHLDASWPGAPSSLALANVDGVLSVNVGKGRIPEVAPGMGRLFGLVSIAELPRRLSLDFGDVFGKGFGFDSIVGTFHLADGNATTDGLAIKGSAAEITIKGRTGLRARDYDQQVLVVPHVGNSLPVVGAVVAGPVGAAAGLAVQGILGKGLNRAASARYRITGSWNKPTITLVEKKNLPVPRTAPPAAPARSMPSRSAPAHAATTASPAPPASAGR